MELSSVLSELQMTVQEISRLKPGDIIPIEPPETVTALVEDIPFMRGVLGNSDGHHAIKITEFMKGEQDRQLTIVQGVQ